MEQSKSYNVEYMRAQSERLEEQVRRQCWVEKVQIEVLDLEFGWETIRMTFDDRVIEYRASYVGKEPVSSLIDAATILDDCYDGYSEDVCYVQWQKEPGCMEMTLFRKPGKDYIDMRIESDDPEIDGYGVYFDYNAFKDAVLKASISVLKRYGIMGYSLAWNMPYNAFPIHKFLALLGIKAERQSCNDECKSNVFEELEILMNVLNQA